jgi:hypothetical protein
MASALLLAVGVATSTNVGTKAGVTASS